MAAFQTTVEGSVKILTISGHLDLQSGADFRETLRSLTEDDESVDLLVDLEGLDYMASAGFRELFLAERKISRQGGRLAERATGGVAGRRELACFDTAYPLFETRREALEFFAGPKPAR